MTRRARVNRAPKSGTRIATEGRRLTMKQIHTLRLASAVVLIAATFAGVAYASAATTLCKEKKKSAKKPIDTRQVRLARVRPRFASKPRQAPSNAKKSVCPAKPRQRAGNRSQVRSTQLPSCLRASSALPNVRPWDLEACPGRWRSPGCREPTEP